MTKLYYFKSLTKNMNMQQSKNKYTLYKYAILFLFSVSML